MMENKKYEFTDETTSIGTKTLYRIRALKDFGDVKKGDLGGFVEREENLSHEGLAWVFDNAQVRDNALIQDNAQVSDNAIVSGCALIYDNAQIYGNAQVSDTTQISGYAQVYGKAQIYDDACIGDNALVYNNAQVSERARIWDSAVIGGCARIYGKTWVDGKARINSGAKIRNGNDFLVIDNVGSRCDTITFFKTNANEISVTCGCFSGSIDKFLSKVAVTPGANEYGDEYRLACKLAKLHINGAQDD